MIWTVERRQRECRGCGESMTEQMALQGGSIGWAVASEGSYPRGISAIWTLKY